jgi:hypothetical protein
MKARSDVVNFKSTAGKEIYALLAEEMRRVLEPLAQEKRRIYVHRPQTPKTRPLILVGADGVDHAVDAIVINNRFQPLVLFGVEYFGGAKRSREKARKIGVAQATLRERYPTARESVTILVGNWSEAAKETLHRSGVEFYEISAERICQTLADYSINSADAEPVKTRRALEHLSIDEREKVARELFSRIKKRLRQSVQETLSRGQLRTTDHSN